MIKPNINTINLTYIFLSNIFFIIGVEAIIENIKSNILGTK